MISSRHIARATVALLKGDKQNSSRVADELLGFVKKYNLESRLPQILGFIQKEADIEREKNTLHIETSHEINEPTIHSISSFVSAPKDAHIKVVTNKKLLGGFVAFWKDKKVDGSLENTVRKLKEKLLTT
jgi:F0F1-type ATP synthase delta subunit